MNSLHPRDEIARAHVAPQQFGGMHQHRVAAIWLSVSLICLKRSRSIWSKATLAPVRAASARDPPYLVE